MAWPTTDVTVTNLDSDTDSPLSARPDLKQAADNVNLIKNHVATYIQGLLDDTTSAAARATLEAAGISVANVFSAAIEIALAVAGNNLTLSTTDAGATGITEVVEHKSSSPAASDIPWQRLIKGRDSAANVQDYAALLAQIVDPTSGTEKGRLTFRVYLNGSAREVHVDPDGSIRLGPDTAKGRIIFPTGANLRLTSNYDPIANTQDNAAKPSYQIILGPDTDEIAFKRSPAGSTTFTDLLKVDGTGAAYIGTDRLTPLVSGTSQATTSGTQFDFTIPSWAKRITVSFEEVSLSTVANILVQLGDSGGIEETGYFGNAIKITTGGVISAAVNNTGFVWVLSVSGTGYSGNFTLTKHSGNTYIASHTGSDRGASAAMFGGGIKTLSDSLTTVRLKQDGLATFDNGSVNVHYQ